MEKGNFILLMAVITMGIGLMVNNMDMEFTLGQTAISIRGTGTRAYEMDKANFNMQMGPLYLKDNGKIISLLVDDI